MEEKNPQNGPASKEEEKNRSLFRLFARKQGNDSASNLRQVQVQAGNRNQFLPRVFAIDHKNQHTTDFQKNNENYSIKKLKR